jgi:Pyruvate/2-oxoacid:ferredoxin oxidoreductase delta subunit
MDNYERLREILHKNPIGAPPSRAFDEILRILFTPEEAEVAVGMTFVPQSVEQIAKFSGVSRDKVESVCESMAMKGIVFSRQKKGQMGYSLLPTMPGLFEFPFMTGGGTPVHDRLARLWTDYHEEALSHEFGGSKTPVMRVIPIEHTIDAHSEVMHFELVSKMLEKAEAFGLAHCACRVSVGACNKPRETCLMFDSTARFLIDRKLAREITKEEAIEVLRLSEEAGLVHTCTNSQDRLAVICNCCPCCCMVLRGWTRLKNPNAFAKSRWHASVDAELCAGCATCRDERCPVSAIELIDETAQVEVERCIGCGLCVSACPERAISMLPRKDPVFPPATVQEMGVRVLTEKGRLEDYLSLNKR